SIIEGDHRDVPGVVCPPVGPERGRGSHEDDRAAVRRPLRLDHRAAHEVGRDLEELVAALRIDDRDRPGEVYEQHAPVWGEGAEAPLATLGWAEVVLLAIVAIDDATLTGHGPEVGRDLLPIAGDRVAAGAPELVAVREEGARLPRADRHPVHTGDARGEVVQRPPHVL